jgi:hypothetical protein
MERLAEGSPPAPPAAREETPEEFIAFNSLLSPRARSALAAQVPEEAPEVDLGRPRYLLVESHDGELPCVRSFGDPADLAVRLSRLDGRDVAVAVAIGRSLRVSKGTPRYVELPDGVSAMLVPPYVGATPTVVALADLPELEWQDDGFLGDAQFAGLSGPPPDHARGRGGRPPLRPRKPPVEDDWDEDDET